MTHVTAVFTQSAFRFRNDDGSETTATWKAATDTAVSINTGEVFRLRLAVLETAGGAANQAQDIEFAINGGAFTAVGASTAVQPAASATVTDGTATTQQITTGTFVAGEFDSNGAITATSYAGNYRSEQEFSLLIDAAQVADGDAITIRTAGDRISHNFAVCDLRKLLHDAVLRNRHS